MEPPAKRLKRSPHESRPKYTNDSSLNKEESRNEVDTKDETTDGASQRIPPTPTLLTEHELRRRFIYDGSARKGRARLPQKPARIVERAPDTTETSTVVDINVSDGNTTITNSVIVQNTDATVVSFASIGAVTISAQATIETNSSESTSSSVLSDFSQTSSPTISSSTETITISPFPVTSGFNSSTISTSSDHTTTVTFTSTLNVALRNGTIYTLSSPLEVIPPVTTTTSETQSRSHTWHSAHTTTTSSAFSFEGSIYSTEPASSVPSDQSTIVSSSTTGVAGGGSGSATNSTAPSSSTTSSSSGSSPGPATPELVGGVVGGVAGLAVLLLILLAFLRWYRKRMAARGLLPEQRTARSVAPSGPASGNQMSQRSSHVSLAGALMSRFRPQSSATTATAVTAASVPDSERGFQRIAGRKIAPVIGTGSDQYGGNYGAFEREGASAPAGAATRDPSSKDAERGLADSSFYRDSRGFYGGKGGEQSTPASPTLVSSSMGQHTRGSTRDFANVDSIGEDPRDRSSTLDSYAVMRPSPARTPVTSSPTASSIRLPIQQGPSMEPGAPPTPALPTHLAPRRQDGVGRSLASQDGSTRSRFTESV